MEQELRERIEAFKNEQIDLRNDLESFCSDISIDLDVRWKLFVDSELGTVARDYTGFDDFPIYLFDDYSRHQTIGLIDIVQDIESWVREYGDMSKEDIPEYLQKYHGVHTAELVKELKEKLLDSFIKAVVYDW